MKDRYYVVAIQHNKEKDAENRTAPKAFDTFNSAMQNFHETLGNDMKNATLDWSVVIMFDNYGNTLAKERWTREEVEIVEE